MCSISYLVIIMKIGEKKRWKTKHGVFELERIKPEWKVAVAWLVFIGLIVWLVWFR